MRPLIAFSFLAAGCLLVEPPGDLRADLGSGGGGGASGGAAGLGSLAGSSGASTSAAGSGALSGGAAGMNGPSVGGRSGAAGAAAGGVAGNTGVSGAAAGGVTGNAGVAGGSGAAGSAQGGTGGASSVCGNGALESGETCDDGNTKSADGCSALCAIESGWTCTGSKSACVKTGPCNGLAKTCGPSHTDDCCASSPVPGGTFYRSYDGADYTSKADSATVSAFRLDTYEVTVGRFRSFVAAFNPKMIAAGAGKNPNNASDQGWLPSWNASLDLDAAALRQDLACSARFTLWTDAPGDSTAESRPINCVTWFEAEAFCIWDGGRLPTEAEWNFAAAGGAEQRQFPWGATLPGNDSALVSFGCYLDGDFGAACTLADIAPVGSIMAGNGKWGQADLAGNMSEWVQDELADPYTILNCNDCAYTTIRGGSVVRGGSFDGNASTLEASYRGAVRPNIRYLASGMRCARAP